MEAFDKEFRDLIELCSNIMETWEKNKIKTDNGPNPIIKYLNRYKKAYNSTEPEVHQDYLLSVYRKNKKAILSGVSKPDWLTTGTVILQFGEELKKPPTDITIRLSAIYTTALKLRDDTEKKLANLPDEIMESCPEINYPEKFLLHLYRLFRETAPKGDEAKLSELIKELESDLGLTKDQAAPSEVGGMAGMLATMQNMMKQNGIDIQSGKMPSPDQIGDIFTKIFGDSKAGDMAKGATKTLMSGIDIEKPETIGTTVMQNLNNFKETELGKQIMADIGPEIVKIAGPEVGAKLASMAGQSAAASAQIEEPEDIEDDD